MTSVEEKIEKKLEKKPEKEEKNSRIETGVPGMDDITNGGFIPSSVKSSLGILSNLDRTSLGVNLCPSSLKLVGLSRVIFN